MVWCSLQTKKAAGGSDAETKPILTVNKRETGKNIIMNRNPAKGNGALFYLTSTTGIETSNLRAGYADRLTYISFEPTEYTLEAREGYRRILGNPPIRAAPEPRGPL